MVGTWMIRPIRTLRQRLPIYFAGSFNRFLRTATCPNHPTGPSLIRQPLRRIPIVSSSFVSTNCNHWQQSRCCQSNAISATSLRYEFDKFASHAHASVWASSETATVLVTLSIESSDNSLLTVDYRQRWAGKGVIPSSANRRDGTSMTLSEVLTCRFIDRAIRPLVALPAKQHWHVQVSVQASNHQQPDIGIAALNAVAVLLQPHLTQPLAATCRKTGGSGTMAGDNKDDDDDAPPLGHLLYAATADKIVAMEYSRYVHGNEEHWKEWLMAAQDDVDHLLQRHSTLLSKSPRGPAEDEIRQRLGLSQPEESPVPDGSTTFSDALIQQGVLHCEHATNQVARRLFGSNSSPKRDDSPQVSIHSGNPLKSKRERGLAEVLVQQELERCVDEFCATHLVPVDTEYCKRVVHQVMRRAMASCGIQHGTRADGRSNGWQTIRPLAVTVPALPETVHGSALFARGETQVLCTVTLGAPRDGLPQKDPYQINQQPQSYKVPQATTAYNLLPVGSLRFLRSQEAMISDLNSRKIQADKERTGDSGRLSELQRAFLQYDFPAYSTGNVPVGNAAAHNRRALGHGALAERAIVPILPEVHDFPYTIRMTSEVTDSNGSSSMASVCGVALALLDAGVPITSPVAGVSVGLVSDDEGSESLLLDITGTEDHYGQMDFKIAGTRDCVTALQLDVKSPVSFDTVLKALELAKVGRSCMLDEMERLSGSIGGLVPRPHLKDSAPRVEVVRFDPQRKRDLIGPGGVILRQMEDRYGVSMDLTQEGQCLIFGTDKGMVAKAKTTVMDLVADVEVGEVYTGTVVEIKDFGAIIELLRNKEGLLHVSELSDEDPRHHPEGVSGHVRHYLRVGQEIEVICIGIDHVQGSIKLSRKIPPKL